jgi:hypothetical protein
MENKKCIKCKEEINPLRLKALPTAKTCVECSTTGAKRGVPITFGEKDHTWTDMVIMDPEEFDQFEKLHEQKLIFEDSDKTDEEDEETKLWDNTLLDGLDDI